MNKLGIVYLAVALWNIIYWPMFGKIIYEHNKVGGWTQATAILPGTDVTKGSNPIYGTYSYADINTTARINDTVFNVKIHYPPPPKLLNIKSDFNINDWISKMIHPQIIYVDLDDSWKTSNKTYLAYQEPIDNIPPAVIAFGLLYVDTMIGGYFFLEYIRRRPCRGPCRNKELSKPLRENSVSVKSSKSESDDLKDNLINTNKLKRILDNDIELGNID